MDRRMVARDAVITTQEELSALCKRISTQSWVALDTEFWREKSYYAELCLIQVGTQDEIACVDVLALDSLDGFFEVLFNQKLTKVFLVVYTCTKRVS